MVEPKINLSMTIRAKNINTVLKNIYKRLQQFGEYFTMNAYWVIDEDVRKGIFFDTWTDNEMQMTFSLQYLEGNKWFFNFIMYEQ